MTLEEFSGSIDQIIVKGKRTKRPRMSSSTSSSSGGGVGGATVEFYNLSSPSASSTCTEEDEDMANCLILLARSGTSPPPAEEEIKLPEKIITSRKFTEMPTTTIGKVDIYVYECKTCNRSFPSFQALGGHRASHKRLKLAGDITDQMLLPPPAAKAKLEEGQCVINTTVMSPPHSTKLVHKSFRLDQNKTKIHECSICGSEFGSGQALGGHMRRHRAAGTPNNNMRIGSGQVDNDSSEKGRNILLDLNLPAPAEDDRSFHQFPGKLGVSAAALVDCQY